MKKALSIIISVCIFLSFTGCTKSSSSTASTTSTAESKETSVERDGTFDTVKAIAMVVKDHPDFPSSQSETITKQLPTGGPSGTTRNVKFTTKVEKSSKSTFIVSITKDWGITVNGKYAESSWKYEVTPNSVTLLESNDNDSLIDEMK